jgi:hypothetical protein
MTEHFLLFEPQAVIGRQWNKNASPEVRQLLALARDVLFFIFDTGQRYDFDDFQEGHQTGAQPQPGEVPAVPGLGEFSHLQERLGQAEGFFTKLRDEPESIPERGSIQLILDTLHFIAATDQYSALNEYLEYIAAGGPPYAVASFDAREEAERWLQQHPHPPDSANILIANTYHSVIHDRVNGTRRLLRSRDLEYYLDEHQREVPPAAAASFNSLGEADAWLQSQPKPVPWAWVSIAGEFYLAAYYPHLDHRALFPLALAKAVETGDSPQE